MSQSVDISKLSLQQISEVRKQLEAEIDHLSQSTDQLKLVLGRYVDCSQSVKTTSDKGKQGSEIMIPLTASLYVPGRMADVRSFLVDVGTNYYVEKDGESAAQFFDTKIENLNKNLVELEKLLKQKVDTLRDMDAIFKDKFRAALKEEDEKS